MERLAVLSLVHAMRLMLFNAVRVSFIVNFQDKWHAFSESTPVELTPCQQALAVGFELLGEAGESSLYVPQCTEEGEYRTMQCHAEQCWCVDEENTEVEGTRATADTVQCGDGLLPIFRLSTNTSFSCQNYRTDPVSTSYGRWT